MAQLAVIVLRLGDSCSGNPDLSGSSAHWVLQPAYRSGPSLVGIAGSRPVAVEIETGDLAVDVEGAAR